MLVKIAKPPHALGKNTVEAIQSGVLYGVLGALRELVEQFAERLGGWPMGSHALVVVLLFMKVCDFADRHVEDLTLAASNWPRKNPRPVLRLVYKSRAPCHQPRPRPCLADSAGRRRRSCSGDAFSLPAGFACASAGTPLY